MGLLAGETSREMLRFLRNTVNDVSLNIISESERNLLRVIIKFLEIYSRPDLNSSKDSFLHELKRDVADSHKTLHTNMFGKLSAGSYSLAVETELSTLKEKLRAIGIKDCYLVFAAIAGVYLLRGEISQRDWAWLEGNVSYKSSLYAEETKLPGNGYEEPPPPYEASRLLTDM